MALMFSARGEGSWASVCSQNTLATSHSPLGLVRAERLTFEEYALGFLQLHQSKASVGMGLGVWDLVLPG